MRFAFVDTEFTGEHAHATLVSLGVVGMEGETLSVSFNDYDRDQVTDWLRENVLSKIDESRSVSRREGSETVTKWFDDYARGEPVSLVSTGKLHDLMFLYQLWEFKFPERKYFHYLYCLPDYLNHSAHFDLPTVFYLAGIDPNLRREELLDAPIEGDRHESLYDARVVRACFRKLVNTANFPRLASRGAP